jgi:predicted transposase YbfD/YdcC
MDIMKLKEKIAAVEDPRREWGNVRHRLEDILVIGLCSTICCGEDFVDMEEFGKDREEWLRGFLELPNGIPGSDTFRRVFERVDPSGLARSLNAWLEDARKGGRREVNIDGKTIRGSGGAANDARHVLSAWVGENSITLADLGTEGKGHEIAAIPGLLDLVDVSGDVVSIDAIGCQTAIAAKIREKGADYVLALKDNQPGLHAEVRDYFDWFERERPEGEAVDVWRGGAEKDHGRIETRETLAAPAGWVAERKEWAGIRSIVRCRNTREAGGVLKTTVRHFISSLEPDAKELGRLVRGHWSVENQLHWMLDVVFREDAARARKDNSPLNLNILRKTALSALKRTPVGRLSVRKRMMKASRDPLFLNRLLFEK